MIDRFVERLNSVNTTNVRILVSVGIAAVIVMLLVIGILFRNWLPTNEQIRVLEGVGLFLGVMMGLDVAQFASKRFSDEKYVTAKQGPSPVSITPPSNISVTQEGNGATTVEATPTPAVAAPGAPAVSQPPVKQAAGEDDG